MPLNFFLDKFSDGLQLLVMVDDQRTGRCRQMSAMAPETLALLHSYVTHLWLGLAPASSKAAMVCTAGATAAWTAMGFSAAMDSATETRAVASVLCSSMA